MNRDPLVRLLRAHAPDDAKEHADLEQMQTWARTLERPFDPTQPEAHFTGSAVVVAPGCEKVCLIHHRKLNRWLQPGGHAEPQDGGRLELTAMREAREETGLVVRLHPDAPMPLDVDIHRIPARGEVPEHFHLDVRFLLIASNPERLAASEETLGARWVAFYDAIVGADERPLRRMLRKAMQICSRNAGRVVPPP